MKLHETKKKKKSDLEAFINHMDRAGGGGFRKNHVCPHGGREARGELGACPRGQKCITATHFARINSNALLVS